MTTLKALVSELPPVTSRHFLLKRKLIANITRITLGRYPYLTIETAKNKAHELFTKIANGINPIAENEEAKIKNITLQVAFNDYINARKNLKSSTVSVYTRVMKLYFNGWHDKPLTTITKELIAKKHAKIGETSKSLANLSMQLLRAIFTFASGQYDDSNGRSFFPENPTKIIYHARSWFDVKKRTSIIKQHELGQWYQAVQNLGNINSTSNHNMLNNKSYGKTTIVRDYLLLMLFTGLRKEEAAQLKWQNIDFNSKTLTVIETKNKSHHTLPTSDFIFSLLQARYNNAHTVINSKYVFPGNGAGGYLVEPRKQIAKVVKTSAIPFTLHDLRRTFITIAESLDISAYALKRLLNHKSNGDVTSGYIIMYTERLRKPMQMIADKLVVLIHENLIHKNKHSTALADNVIQTARQNKIIALTNCVL